MESSSSALYVTFVDVEYSLLKIWGQKNRIGATYIERQLSQLIPELSRTPSLNPSRIIKGMLCYAKHLDNYYRARVISNVQGDMVGVFFVDYGNVQLINTSSVLIREGSEDVLLKMAEQADEFYLAGITAPAGGWTKEMINAIRNDICNEELRCNEVAQISGKKFIEIQLKGQDLSSYLVEKHLAQGVIPNLQSQMLIPNSRQMTVSHVMFPPQTSQVGRMITSKSSGHDLSTREAQQQQCSNFQKHKNTANFSQFPSSVQMNSVHNVNKSNPSDSYYSNALRTSSYINESIQSEKTPFDPVLQKQFNSLKIKPGQLLNTYNNDMIEALAHQVKQYIAEGNAKSKPSGEILPYNYVSNVFNVGSTHNIYISCIDDGPWSFSIQLVSSEDELNKVMEEIVSAELVPVKLPMVVGHPCIAASAIYGNLCRGVVVSISHSAVQVCLVDFGDVEDVPITSVYELPQSFFKTRVLSQKFCLTGLQNVSYSEDIKNYFQEIVQDKFLILKVASLEGDTLPSCELYIKNVNIKRLLNEKMQSARITRTSDDGPVEGETENVVVTWVDSMQRFYVQLRRRDAELNALKNELSHVETNGEKLTFEELKTGLLCVCKYMDDEQWYRAKITSFTSEKNITLFYIDYGNTETVDITLLRKVGNDRLISQMKNQAFQCCLHGFESKPCDQDLSHQLESLTLEKELKMTVISVERGGQLLLVKLYIGEEDVVPLVLKTRPKRESPEKQAERSKESQHTVKMPPSNLSGSPDSAKQFEKAQPLEKPHKGFNLERNRSDKDENWRTELKKFNDWNKDSLRGDKLAKGLRQDRDNRFGEFSHLANVDKFSRGQDSGKRRSNVTDEIKFGWNQKPTKRGVEKKGSRDGFDLQVDSKSGKGRVYDWTDRGNKTWMEMGKSSGQEFSFRKNEDGGFDRSGKFKRPEQHPRKSRHAMGEDETAPPRSEFKERLVNLGQSENAVITYYINPHNFYIQVLTEEEDFKKMMQNIQRYYSDKYAIKHQLEVGTIVVTQFSYDNILYRGEVVSGDPLVIRYVDYGNEEEVDPLKSWMVAKQFLTLPKQAVKCRLANINPIEGKWPALGSPLDKFFESEEYKCTFLNCLNGVYEVELESLGTGKNVASEIIASGLGTPGNQTLVVPNTDFSLLHKQVLRLKVSHVENSEKLFVVINEEGLRRVEKELCAFAESLKSLDKSTNESNALCLVKQNDIIWCRGKILNKSEEEVVVFLIDSGNSIRVNPDKIKFIPHHLKVVQAQAVECRLINSSELVSSVDLKQAVENQYVLISIDCVTYETPGRWPRLHVELLDGPGRQLNSEKADQSRWTDAVGQLPIISQELPVIISHVESPLEIYVRLEADRDKFEDLTEKLTSFYKDDVGVGKFEGSSGDLVAANVCGTWYRGRVLGFPSKDNIQVIFLDTGKKESLPRENVKPLDVSFNDFNCLVRKVSLDLEPEPNEELNRKLEALKTANELYGYFINEDGNLLMELVYNDMRITPTLTSKRSRSDKFSELLPIFAEFSQPYEAPASTTTEANVKRGKDETDQSENGLRVFVIHIDSPSRFWIHKESSINEFEQYQEKLQKACETLPNKVNPRTGDVLAALFCDVWYRAVALSVVENILTVQFTDYGNVIDVDLSEMSVKELTPELAQLPTFATQFSLKGAWKESATAKFEEIILDYEDPVIAVVLEETEPPTVDLFKDGRSIFEKLLAAGVAEESLQVNEAYCESYPTVYISHQDSPSNFYIQRDGAAELLKTISKQLSEMDWSTEPSDVRLNEIYAVKSSDGEVRCRGKVLTKCDDHIQVRFVDYGNVSDITEIRTLPKNLQEIPFLSENCCLLLGQTCDAWSDEAFKAFATYADGRPLKMKVVVDRPTKPVVCLFSRGENVSESLARLCAPDDRFEVYITHADSARDFYIRRVNDDLFEEIGKTLNKLNSSDVKDLTDKSPGKTCLITASLSDFVFERAAILENSDEGIQVRLIDSGKTRLAEHLKEPVEMIDILRVPPRALRCTLHNLNKNISESMEKVFDDLASKEGKVFRARIVSSGEPNIVSLKLDGRIVEEALNLEDVARKNESSSDDRKTDDDRTSKKPHPSEVDALVHNETDEEKQEMMAASGSVPGSGFHGDGNRLSDEAEEEDNFRA